MPDENRREASSSAFTSVEELPDLSPKERRTIEERSRPNAALIHETIRAEGEGELARTAVALVLSGFAAGLSMGFSLVVEGLLHAHLPDAPWRGLVSSFGYTIGFLIVVLGRQQLFTENTLTPVLPLLRNRDLRTFGQVLRLWTLVLAANIAATWVFAAAIAHTDIFSGEMKHAFAEISRGAIGPPFWDMFLKAVVAGWLIALMVWVLPATEGGSRPFVIVAITYVVALGGLSHIIVGSVETFFLMERGEASSLDYLNGFFVPTLLGNLAGGVSLVAVLNFGQVAPELE